MKRYIAEGMREFLGKEPVPWHMPGHKRRTDFLSEGNVIDDALAKAMSIDVTELPETDDLYEPEGMIKKSLEEITGLYDTCLSYYVVNGATGGILAAIAAASQYCRDKSCRVPCIAVAENCHKSVINGARIVGADVKHISTRKNREAGPDIYGAVDIEAVRELCGMHKVDALVITSPTYEGIVSDIKELAAELHKNGAFLIVDEAHGAHLPFWRREMSAIYNGADIVVQSLHKTLPAMTQTALIHVNNNSLVEYVKTSIRSFMSSSPSYVMMCSMEAAIGWASEYDFEGFNSLVADFRERVSTLNQLELLDEALAGKLGAAYLDKSRIVITTKHKKIKGISIAAMLKQYGKIMVEMAGTNYVVLIATPMDEEKHFHQLFEVLKKVDKTISDNEDEIVRAVDTADEAAEKVKQLKGKPAPEDMFVYPPGNYVAVKGEIVTDEMVEKLTQYAKSGLIIRGLY